MNPINLTESSKEQKIFKRNILIIGIISAAAGAIAYFFRTISALPPKPPPIIIRSGIFVIEADETLTETADEASTETLVNPNLYKRKGFGRIKGVRVFKTNEESGLAESYDYEDKRGVEVDIRLQKHSPQNGWEDINPLVTIRTLDNASNSKDFVLKIGKKLKKKGFPNPARPERWEDDGTEYLRFGRVVVRENDGGGDTFDSEDGDHYLISFYNRLV
jgi:hypothetical protein